MLIVGRGLQTMRTHGFVSGCVAPGADRGGVDNRLVEVLVVVRHPWRILWTMSGPTFSDDEGQKGWMLSCRVECIRNPAHFLAFPLRQLLQDPRSSFRPLNDTKDARPHVLVTPPPSSAAGSVYDSSLSSIAR